MSMIYQELCFLRSKMLKFYILYIYNYLYLSIIIIIIYVSSFFFEPRLWWSLMKQRNLESDQQKYYLLLLKNKRQNAVRSLQELYIHIYCVADANDIKVLFFCLII